MDVLVIDDSRDICGLIENILLSEGYTVSTCWKPLEILQSIEKYQPNLIITDLLMAGYDGRALTKELRSNPETAEVKIIMMSAHPDALKISRQAGVDDFLSKPFEIDDLVQKVQILMKGKLTD